MAHDEHRLKALEEWRDLMDAAWCGELKSGGRQTKGVFHIVSEFNDTLYGNAERRIKGVVPVVEEHDVRIQTLEGDKKQDQLKQRIITGVITGIITAFITCASVFLTFLLIVKNWPWK